MAENAQVPDAEKKAADKRRSRRVFGAVAVTAGVALAVFEYRPAMEGQGEDVFWLIVAGLLIVFGAAEAFSKR